MENVENTIASFIKYHSVDDYTAALNSAGKMIEQIFQNIYIKETSLPTASMNYKKYVSFIRKKELIPASILTHIYALQNFRNAGTHVFDFVSEEDYKTLLPHLEIIFRWYYKENYSASNIFSNEFEIRKLLDDNKKNKIIFIVLQKDTIAEILFLEKVKKLKEIIVAKVNFETLIVEDTLALSLFNNMEYNFISIGTNRVTEDFLSQLHIQSENSRYRFKSHSFNNLVLVGNTHEETRELIEKFIVDLDGLTWYLNNVRGSVNNNLIL